LRRTLLDTTIFIYAVGAAHRYREPCREVVAQLERGALAGEASVELVHEFAHVRLRRVSDRRAAIDDARAVSAVCRLHDLERRDLELGLELVERHGLHDVRDGIFAATAFNRGIDAILTVDRDFDAIPDLERIDPADREAVDALLDSR
jgi:uncharacterized protein